MLTSKCCNAKVEIGGEPDFPGDNYICTHYYICTKCGEACDLIEDKTVAIPRKSKEVSECCHAKIEDTYNGEDGYWETKCTQCKLHCKEAQMELNIEKDVLHVQKTMNTLLEPVFKDKESVKEHLERLEKEKTFIDHLRWIWRRVTDFYYDGKWYIKRFYQRGKNGWAVADTWDMDDYLLDVLPQMLDRVMNEDRDEKYNLDIQDCANTLRYIKKEYYSIFMTPKQVKECQKYINYAFKLLAKRFMQLWD
jgi:hypothetical protein